MNKMMLIILTLGTIACMTSTIAPIATKSAPTTPTQTAIVATIANLPTSRGQAGNDEPASGTVFEIPTPSRLCATVTAIQSLHLRTQQNERAVVIGYLRNGEQVRVIAFGPWWKISTAKGTGYANAKYLRLTECME